MAIRDSQDVNLGAVQRNGTLRDSQDLALGAVQRKGALRNSQDVTIVLARARISGTATTAQPQSLSASGFVTGATTAQAPQTLTASGSVIIHVRDSQELTLAAVLRAGAIRDSQDVTLGAVQRSANLRDSQDVTLVIAYRRITGSIVAAQNQTLDASGRLIGCFTTQTPQTLAASGSTFFPNTRSGADKKQRQLHPVRKPLDFLARPLKQAGKRSATFTTVLTAAGASRAFSMPMGGRNRPVAGRVFTFTMGGSLALGSVGGTLIVTPFYGATADGANLGPSAVYTYAANYAKVTQWRLKGEIVFRQVDLTPGLSSVICSGAFVMGGDPQIPGSGVTILFGSASPIQVDTASVAPSASGALNFAATFAPFSMNAVPPSISVKYAFLRS